MKMANVLQRFLIFPIFTPTPTIGALLLGLPSYIYNANLNVSGKREHVREKITLFFLI